MAIEIVIPRMGMTMEEGTIVAWLKEEGDRVVAKEPLFEIETDKTNIEIEAPGDGILGRVLAHEGETLPIGTVIGYIVAEGEAIPEGLASQSTPLRPAEVIQEETAMAVPLFEKISAEDKIRASLGVRYLARELGVDMRGVIGTGPGGRVVAWNVEGFTQAQPTQPAQVKISPIAKRLATESGIDLNTVKGTGPAGRITREDIERAVVIPSQDQTLSSALQPISRHHRVMADRMSASWSTAPHFYLHSEVDARHLLAARDTLLPKVEALSEIRLTLTDLIVKLCANSLAKHPIIMAQWREQGILLSKNVNIGLAVDSPAGLIVPVIRDADQLDLIDIARHRGDLVKRAQDGKLLPQDLELGVFTVTNLGMFRVDYFEAILNPPQAAILAVGRIKERPTVEDGRVISSPTIILSLSIDHRVLDGVAGARFLGDLVDLIETPGLTLI